MATAITIRTALIEDASSIAEVHIESWRQGYRGLLPERLLADLSVQQREVMWMGLLAKGKPLAIVVAEVDGQVVGFATFGPCRNEKSGAADHELWALYVHPSHWSAGVGWALWQKSREDMVSEGAVTISLWSLERNERASRFYQGAGFDAQLGSRRAVRIGDAQFQQIRWKLLTAPSSPSDVRT